MPSLSSKIRAATESFLVQAKHDSVNAFFGCDYSVHLTDQIATGGHQIVRKFLELYRIAFPDIKADVEILVEERIEYPVRGRCVRPTKVRSRGFHHPEGQWCGVMLFPVGFAMD